MKTTDEQCLVRKNVHAFQLRWHAYLLLASLTFCIPPCAHADHYVAQNGQTPSGTYTTWNSAASDIQDAVNVAYTNSTVWVGAGRYTTPTNFVDYFGTNVVYIDRALTLRSSNGVPESTIIDGQGSNRGVAIVYSGSTTNLFVVNGFTISNCSAQPANTGVRCYGGGIMFKPAGNSTWTGVVQNCVISDNSVGPGSVYDDGAGIYGGYTTSGGYYLLVTNCTIRGNRNLIGDGGGIFAYPAPTARVLITDCLIETNWAEGLGGGIYCANTTVIENSVIRSNVTAGSGKLGGAVYHKKGIGVLRNCLIHDNGNQGAVCANSGSLEVYNCTIVNNRGWGARVDAGGQLYIYNSISYSNSGGNLYIGGESGGFTNTCSFPSNSSFILSGTGNITNNPQLVNFAGQNFQLTTDSPCLNTGLNQDWMTNAVDLEGKTRIRYGTVDMGAYELIYDGTIYKFH